MMAQEKPARNKQGIILSLGFIIILGCGIWLESVDANPEMRFAVFAPLILCLYILTDIVRQKRIKRIRDLASQQAFTHVAHPREEIPSQLRNMSFFRYKGTLRNMVQGERKGVRFVLVDREKRFYQWPWKERGAECKTAVALYARSFNLPAFELEPEMLDDKITCLLLGNDIDFPSHPEFSRKYLLYGQEERRVRDVFNSHVLAFFETTEGWSVESEGDWVVLYKRDEQVECEDILSFLDEALGILGRLTGEYSSAIKMSPAQS
jgi:hypothetical protein